MWYGLALFDGYLIPSRFIKENSIRRIELYGILIVRFDHNIS